MEVSIPMKILLISTSDSEGGAARACMRLHQSLQQSGVETLFLVLEKKSGDAHVHKENSKWEANFGRFMLKLEQLPVRLHRNRTQSYFSTGILSRTNLARLIRDFNPDIIHLHWIHGGMLSIKQLSKLRKPIVWSLHDMWAFTGGCHYTEECTRYLHGCGECKVLGSTKSKDLSSSIFNKKQAAYQKLPQLIPIGLSKWMATCAKQSRLLGHLPIAQLPNPINIQLYKPLQREACRMLWNLPLHKKIVLFGAVNSSADPRKGYAQLLKALRLLPPSEDLAFFIFGSNCHSEISDLPFPVYHAGMLQDDASLVTLYNACDVMIVPSLQENLSNAIMESLACGTPVVAFDIGGNADMIHHKQNGYLAQPFLAEDLAHGIDFVLQSHDDSLRTNARESVTRFSYPVIAKRYTELYQGILNHQRKV
jgi:glycosyltransferase involved in cell wall biosynthesis